MDPYIGEVRIFTGNFAPVGWQMCWGQLLPISEYSTLYNLIGTTYGGDGMNTFGVPDMRGRVPVHTGAGINTLNVTLGEPGGEENHTLNTSEMGAHNHGATVTIDKLQLKVSSAAPSKDIPTAGSSLAARGGTATDIIPTFIAAAPATIMNAAAITPAVTIPSTPAGGSQPHENMQPWLAVNFIIATEGIWPSQT